ncbi:MAG: CocE/NonD family hydrolase [Bacteroidales bacterium]
MKFFTVLFLFCACFSGLYSAVDQQWIKENYTKQEFQIPMRDSITLYTAVYRPNQPQNSPILIMRTPYSCGNYGAEFENFAKGYMRAYLEKGYIIVKQDVRGRYLSEGVFEHIKPLYSKEALSEGKADHRITDEATDVYDTVEWLLKHISGHNGRVGLVGNSYPGFYALMGGLSEHPAIRAISPQAPVVDWFIGDDFHQNGALKLGDSFHFHNSFGKPHYGPTKKYPQTVRHYNNDEYTFFLEKGTLQAIGSLFGDSISFWPDMMEHPDYDFWWQQRNALRHCTKLQMPVLIAGGFYDAEDSYGAFTLYHHLMKNNPENPVYLAAGPWSHGQWRRASADQLGKLKMNENTARWFQDSIEIPFFDQYLRDDNALSADASCFIFVSGSNRKMEFRQWPPKQVQPVSFYLNGAGSLTENKQKKQTESAYISDPASPVPYSDRIANSRNAEYMVGDQRFATRRPDVLTYRSEPLTEDMSVMGQAMIDLAVQSSASDADFIVKIIDEYPASGAESQEMNGYQMLIRGEVMRGRYRNGMDKPSPLRIGKTESIRWTTVDMAHTFKKGHRVVVQVQSSWFPLIDRNPQQYINIYQCDVNDFIPAGITILEGGKNGSSVRLPVVKSL